MCTDPLHRGKEGRAGEMETHAKRAVGKDSAPKFGDPSLDGRRRKGHGGRYGQRDRREQPSCVGHKVQVGCNLPQVQNVPQHQNSLPMQTRQASQHKSVRARLPKLRKFDGKLHDWQEFWDSFESAIHRNDMLENVDKFSYLRGLLVGPARSAIAGFALTSANYQAAVELLNKRYEKKEAIQRAYVNELLNV